MVIVEREGKYFLQISNGELELSEKQAKSRLDKGLAVLKVSSEYAPETNLSAFNKHTEGSSAVEAATTPGIIEKESETTTTEPAATKQPIAAAGPIDKIPTEAQAFILSDEYYDNIIREFEKVYVANGRKEETALELLDHCQKSIDHLKLERSQPNADLALLDYQRICWLRIIVFLQALTGVPAPKHPDLVAQEKEKQESERNLVKQLLVIQLLQETGAFPYADALKSITHDSIIGLVARILNKDKSVIKTGMQRSGDILLRRNVSAVNAPKRLRMLVDIESYFADLPYTHIIIRLKSLKEFYKNYGNK
jgi:hypothetical protein